VLTPNIDTLAADGIILNNYYTSPLCSPSRSAFLSGHHPIHTGDQHYNLVNAEPRGFSLNHQLLPQYLKTISNYSAHLIGKWNLGFFRQMYTPLYRGFDSFYGYLGSKLDYFKYESAYKHMRGFDLRNNAFLATDANGYLTDLLTEQAVKVIERHDVSQPLYLHYAFPNTHCANADDPLQAQQKYIKKFDHIKDTQRRIYAANIFALDESIGLLVRALHSKNLIENSIIVFVSDNGAGDRGVFPNSGSNWPLRGVKGTLWEGSLRVPSFIWSPLLKLKLYKESVSENTIQHDHKTQHPQVYDQLFHVTDWLPTLLDAVVDSSNATNINQALGKSFDEMYGVSHWAHLADNHRPLASNRPARRELLHNIDPIDQVAALRVGDYKLIRGAIPTDLSGWYGRRHLMANDTSAHLRTGALREMSSARAVLAQLGRRPNYQVYQSVGVRCDWKESDTLTPPSVSKFTGIVSLFNIAIDPCERNNIASVEPNVLRSMSRRMEELASTAIEAANLPDDINSDPALHGGAWVSWLDAPHDITQAVVSRSATSQAGHAIISNGACQRSTLTLMLLCFSHYLNYHYQLKTHTFVPLSLLLLLLSYFVILC